MRKSLLLKALLFAAFPMFATDDETAAAEPNADVDAPDAASTADANAPVGETSLQEPPVDGAAAVPIVQTPTPVEQSGAAGDPVLETVKTPAHNVADEIHAEIQKLEQLPAEALAWFEAKFGELKAQIKALL